MKSMSKVFIRFVVLVSIMALVAPVMAVNDPGDYTFKGKHEYDKGSILKIGGDWYIDGTKITASAATINAAASGLATNAEQVATCSNLTVMGTASVAGDTTVSNFTATGTVTVPAASVGAAALSGNIDQARITNALATAGATIGGNLPVASMTNALAGTAYTTNTLTGDGVTNVFIWATVGPVKVLYSITTTP